MCGYQEHLNQDEAETIKFRISNIENHYWKYILKKKKKIKYLPEFTRYSVNSDRLVISNDMKPKNSESGTFLTPISNIKVFKIEKFNFTVFSAKPGFRGFPENYKKTQLSEVAIQNFGKFRIFLDLSRLKRMENDRMHSGIDGRTDIWQIIICNNRW